MPISLHYHNSCEHVVYMQFIYGTDKHDHVARLDIVHVTCPILSVYYRNMPPLLTKMCT